MFYSDVITHNAGHILVYQYTEFTEVEETLRQMFDDECVDPVRRRVRGPGSSTSVWTRFDDECVDPVRRRVCGPGSTIECVNPVRRSSVWTRFDDRVCEPGSTIECVDPVRQRC